jgi:hypothetical protein
MITKSISAIARRTLPPDTVNFDLFGKASPRGQDLVLLWHRRAKRTQKTDTHDPFEAFMYLWLGFNNWAMRVTEADTDAEMIDALAKSSALNKKFSELLKDNEGLKVYAKTFALMWPIFNVKHLRKKNLRHQFDHLDRPEYTRRLLAARVKHAPKGTFSKEKPSWDVTIRAIYQARCNLMHGEKGDSSDDYHIIEGAYRTLLTFIDATELYKWRSPDGVPAQ